MPHHQQAIYGFKSKATKDYVLLIVLSHLIVAVCAVIQSMFELDIFEEGAFVESHSLSGLFNISLWLQTYLCCINDISPLSSFLNNILKPYLE